MKLYNRIMLSEGGRYVKDCLDNNYIGVNFLKDIDLSNIPHTDESVWKQNLVAKYLESHPDKTSATARMAIGFMWTVCYGLKTGDVVLAPNGEGGYYVAEITGSYFYAQGKELSHRRTVKWLNVIIQRSSMSQKLQNSTGSIGTCCNISKYADELQQLINGSTPIKIINDSLKVENFKERSLHRLLSNYLFSQNKDEQKNLILSPLIKVKANKLAEKLNDELMNDERTVIVEQKVGIEFSNIEGIKPCSFKMENDIPKYTYSVRFIKQCDNVQLIANSCYLFNWMNRHFLLELINKNSEVDVLESIAFDMSKNAYPAFNYFLTKNRISLCQLCGYNDILTGMQTSVEQELKKFYEVHLKDKYNYPSLVLNFPNVTDSWLNKCRVLLPELDSVVKQYNTYVEYDEVDIDIIKYSKPLKVTEGKSLLINKYFEINKDNIDISRVLYNMFASGAMLNYVEPYKDKHYHCLYDLLSNENSVSYNNYEDDQKHEIDFLVNQNILKKDDNGLLSLFNIEQTIALQSLWEYHACAYWHYNTEGRNALDEMFTKGWVVKKDNLLTTEERKYFSYCLDNSEFTNGLAYRNHYAHGSTPPKDNENIHQTAYFTILKLLTILILKIEDDLWSASKALSIGVEELNKIHDIIE